MDAQAIPQYIAIALASGVLGFWLNGRTSIAPAPASSHSAPFAKPLPPDSSATPASPAVPAYRVSTSDITPTPSRRRPKQKHAPAPSPLRPADTIPEGSIQDPNSDSEDEREAISHDLENVKAGRTEECKLVLVVNMELGMAKGKMAAQCSHATLACYKTLLNQNPILLRQWEQTGQAKVAVKASSEADLLELQRKARSLNLCARSIQDAGRTQIAAGSRTVLGIGPGPVKLINQVTGHLKLL